MANGSKRSFPTSPKAAAVVSELMIEPMNTPCVQLNASRTSGTTVARRPPNMIASIGTPAGSSHSEAIAGSWPAGAVKREFGWAATRPASGVQSRPVQSTRWSGGVGVKPSHQVSPSSVRAVFVKMMFRSSVRIALGLDFVFVPGATPKKPASGLIA